MKQIVVNTFGKMTFKRRVKVKTMASVTTSVKVFNKRVDVDPHIREGLRHKTDS